MKAILEWLAEAAMWISGMGLGLFIGMLAIALVWAMIYCIFFWRPGRNEKTRECRGCHKHRKCATVIIQGDHVSLCQECYEEYIGRDL